MDELRMQADNEVMTEDKNRHAEDDNDMTDGEISAHHAQHTAPSHKSFHHSVSRALFPPQCIVVINHWEGVESRNIGAREGFIYNYLDIRHKIHTIK